MIRQRRERQALMKTYMHIFNVVSGVFLSILFCTDLQAKGPAMDLTWVTVSSIEADTIPVQDNYGDHVTDPNRNPFDILPKEVEQKVEYDPETGNYIIFEKIGDEYYRTPTYLTFEEYLEYRKRQQERNYFSQMAGLSTGKKKKLNLNKKERQAAQWGGGWACIGCQPSSQ